MMKKVYPILVTLSLLCFTACWGPEDPDKECEVVPVAGDDNNIVGRWKLVEWQQVVMINGGWRIENYSCDNIVYHFQEDGILSVSSDVTKEFGGEFHDGSMYELAEESFDNYYSYKLKIGTLGYWFSLTDGIMKLDRRPTDGPLLTLIRIE
ncbi:MAG: hypothetical protein JJU34_13695 [Lunatimonas sp.]|uniref:hypothetical protein n=1 Tax=Lunatimonas sp. TaxID=2060141 RepID=UPI00263A9ADF|nr:hypothetical protein [Lunatimonas sp.]MCC5938326.1 hypothetical protein [Lunatimonas sp.]